MIAAGIGRRLARTLFHPPRKKHHRHPADLNLPASELTVRTSDGIDLHLWLVPGLGTGTVIVGHGIGLTKSASLRHAALLHGLGYHVLLFDHRNHGRSGTDDAQDHLAERYSNDITACTTAAANTWPESETLIIWGFSFSTFPTLHCLRQQTTPIDAIICDSGPGLDLDATLRHFLTGGGLHVPAAIRSLLRRPAIVTAFASSAVTMLGTTWPPEAEATAAGSTPMLFLIGTEDRVVQPEQIQALALRYPDATVAEFPAGHLQGLKSAPQQYTAAVTSFLDSLASLRGTS
ncbi:alpha/beta hydrolase [Nesterenkonia muleiensis]|uniref:alpha/beta hydrolase n=1 Tax=Nesterenkonia muleiensis TaxID=2282648 RepID=UPI000E739C90|nr:alpha/beta fold hydrolase [Nesterenkonia muleiensis]